MPIEEPTSNYWGMLIKSLRVSQQVSQFQLAEVLGVDQATVSRWERGLSEPHYEMRKALHGLAREAGLATLGDLTNIVNFSPFPMILVDRWQEVIAASVCSGFKPGLTVTEQTPPEEQVFLKDFATSLRPPASGRAAAQNSITISGRDRNAAAPLSSPSPSAARYSP
jgi:transcriptional regulator with XRE-family HTH domain